MRVLLIGTGPLAKALRSKVYADEHLHLVDDGGRVDVTLELIDSPFETPPMLDGAFSTTSRLLTVAIEQVVERCGAAVVVGATGQVHHDTTLAVTAHDPDGDVASALYRALLLLARPHPQPQPAPRWRWLRGLGVVALLAVLASPARAQLAQTQLGGAGGGSGVSQADGSAFALGSTVFAPGGGTYQVTATALADGTAAAFRITTQRALHVNLRDASGNELPLPAALAGLGGLKVECLSGCGSPPATPDNAAFVAGTTNVTDVAGVFNDSLAALSSGFAAAYRMTAYRALHVSLRDASGNAITTLPVSGTFWQATQPVSGTFWQTTQPISGPALSSVSATLSSATCPGTGCLEVTSTASMPGSFFIEWIPNLWDVANTAVFRGGPAATSLETITCYALAAPRGPVALWNLGTVIAQCPGSPYFRIETTAYASGTAAVKIVSSSLPFQVPQTTFAANQSVAIAGGVAISGSVQQGGNGTNAFGWWTLIGDGINGAVAVKPASTAAAAADPALVVRAVQLPTALAAHGGLVIEGVASGVAVPVSLASAPTTAVTNVGLTDLDATVVATGTVAPTKGQAILGKTNDGTAQYQFLPEGAAGRSVIVEGVAGGTALPVSGTVTVTEPNAATATSTFVGALMTETTLLASNAARRGFIVTNQSSKVLLLKFGTGIGSSSYTAALPPGQSFSIGVSGPAVYTGTVTGIWFGLDGGGAIITEL